MKKGLIGLMLAGLLLLTACGEKSKELKKDEATLKVGVVLSVAGLGDKSFNDSAHRGLKMAKKELGIEFKYVEPGSSAEDEDFLRQFAEGEYDLIIGTGFLMKEAVEKVAKEYPNLKFASIDGRIKLENVSSLLFKEDEGSFLVGALAAMMSKTGKVGFVGGMEVPLIKKFNKGYENGVMYINKDATVFSLYTNGINPFNDPVRGKENALSEIKQGADVVYHAAGGTGFGVIEAAKESGVYAIGVDSNQDSVAPGVVLTSMIKNVDIVVYTTIKDVIEDRFQSGIREFGLAEGGVSISDFEFTKDKIPEDVLKKLDEIKEKIIAGEIDTLN